MYLFIFLLVAGVPFYGILKPRTLKAAPVNADRPKPVDLPFEIEASTIE